MTSPQHVGHPLVMYRIRSAWVTAWTHVAQAIEFTPQVWMSASICSFAVAAVATLLVGGLTSAARRRGKDAPAGEQAGG